MPITLRKRGEVWHARGSIRIGKEVLRIAEFSTGCRSRADAEDVVRRQEQQIREERNEEPAARGRRVTIAECLSAYARRPGGLKRYDVERVRVLNEAIGVERMADAPEAWGRWLLMQRWAPATAARWRATLQAALNAGAASLRAPKVILEGIRQSTEERIPYLNPRERDRLLAAYSPHAACPVLLLAHQGMRTQEALQLDWREIDLTRETIRILGARSKSGKGRTIPMHPRVVHLLVGLWHSAGKPERGPVFLSRRGAPYTDTKDRARGGNPLTKAHTTACKAARITDFRVHDWRHSWAAERVMAGVDLYTLMRLGGWSSLKMVERYAGVTADHMREAIRRSA